MLSRYRPQALSILRIVTAFLFLMHGIQKTLGAFGGLHLPPTVPASTVAMLTAAGWIETIGGLFLLLGLFTSPVAFLVCGEMAVAFFANHVARTGKLLPIENMGAEAVLNCFIFLYIFVAGGGAWSLDALRGKKSEVNEAEFSSRR